MRSKTLSVRKDLRELRALGASLPSEGEQRPRTRGDCVGGLRPCPWAGCRHHLYLDINPESGSVKINFPDRDVTELDESCSLDVADRGALVLDDVGLLMNLTRERSRQIEFTALFKLKGESVIADVEATR